MVFNEENGEPIQSEQPYKWENINHISFDCESDFDEFAKKYATTPIGLVDKQLHKFTIFDLNGETGILAKSSHLISDAWTFSLYAKEFYALYIAIESGLEITQSERSYLDYVKAEQDYYASERYQRYSTQKKAQMKMKL